MVTLQWSRTSLRGGNYNPHRLIQAPDGEFGLNYLCAGYKLFFNHIDPYMKFMAEELRHNRAPANVMHCAALLRDRAQGR